MKISQKTFVALISVGLFLPVLALAASPGIPHKFYGTVNFNNGVAPNGLMVEAKIGGITMGSSVTNEGKYGYLPDLLFATNPNNDNAGKIVEFYVSGIKANETAIFASNDDTTRSTNLDLTVPGTVGTIEETNEDAVIENKTAPIAPTQPTNIKLGNNLNITVSSETNTSAVVNEVKKLTSSFFTGSAAVIAGNNLLNAFEINITGTDLTISVTISYDDTGIDESTIMPYRFDGTSWVIISPYTLNTSANTITFSVSSAETPYAIFGSEPAPAPTPPAGGGGGGGAATTDTTAPSISAINAVVGDTTATITWQTNEASISWLVYGKTTTYGEEVKITTYVASHSVTLNDLSPATTYHYQIKSKDATGNTASYTDKTFVTLALGVKITGDINKDDKVDIFDFNLLMVNWGNSPANLNADLDGNGKVDIFDFNLLMVNWTG
ncbi:hypothetical protein A2127_01355 [Candidatus Jorgensenbacteria bacterium GWC1_48_12]|uniref:Fibronectin type-III domain-containing protein n=1 Tax=Candidatus Jorgensenbacteria bacterium GWC1_48_12 TaxID=1798469 RepID=A0A1F6BPD1_9BACT|nr:MAG: hypothetical protein A2127_01355 [Candidatus Jorgensenbacteria bacterium GWC1_48_12]